MHRQTAYLTGRQTIFLKQIPFLELVLTFELRRHPFVFCAFCLMREMLVSRFSQSNVFWPARHFPTEMLLFSVLKLLHRRELRNQIFAVHLRCNRIAGVVSTSA